MRISEITKPTKIPVNQPTKTVKAYKLFRTDDAGNLYPLYINNKTPLPMNTWLPAEIGAATPSGKVKSKLGPLAMRPGWHAGDVPVATHIGGKSQGKYQKKPDYRPDNQVWAEVEMADDVDWQSEANRRAERNRRGEIVPRTAHVTDQVPAGGHYRYKTNPNMTGEWLIGGEMRILRVLSDDEVKAINQRAGLADLPRLHEL
jgi:hypothetical protein